MYSSRLPVCMDGSCNGLQHYAALGRDLEGGKQVNLVPSSRPQDVYTGVASLVEQRVAKAAAAGDKIGKLLEGKVTRKLVKQTVMTSVYGVTIIGARSQIENRLREMGGIPDDMMFTVAFQLARWTLDSLGDMFSGASRTMDWLSSAAKTISRQGSEVMWVTPLGLPVIQPYRKRDRQVIKTVVQRIHLGSTGDHMPVSTARQQSAFAPNFVHSIDSSHMLLTSVACRKAGLSFAAVHDSFWTHAATVDEMNGILRHQFVDLHRRELLVELRENFQLRHPEVRLPPLPKRGELDLDVVLESPYFFS
jgi:DNA-directed RNA polymerase, mitochondrial